MEQEQTQELGTLEVSSIKHETPKAWLAVLQDDSEIWFPKSQCNLDGNTLSCPEWLLREKGIEDWD